MVLLAAQRASGWLSDRFVRKPVLMLSTALGVMCFTVIIGLYSGTQSTMMIESTPSRIRCTAVGLGQNICFGVVGGLTPLVAVWLVERTADELAPAYLIMVAAAVSFLGACRMKETLRTSLPD